MPAAATFSFRTRRLRGEVGSPIEYLYGIVPDGIGLFHAAQDSSSFTDQISVPVEYDRIFKSPDPAPSYPMAGFFARPDRDEDDPNVNWQLFLIVTGDLWDRGWTSIICEQNSRILHRRHAGYLSLVHTETNEKMTAWMWNMPYPGDGGHALEWVQPDYKTGDDRTIWDTNSHNKEVTIHFLNKSLKDIGRKRLSKDLSLDGTTSSQFEVSSIDSSPQLLGQTIQGLDVEIKGTNLINEAYIYPHSNQPPGSAPIGPRLINATNCKAYFSCGIILEQNASSNTLDIPEHIIGKSSPSSLINTHRNALIGKEIISEDGSFRATISDVVYSAGQRVAQLMDIDLDGEIDGLTDGLLFLRQAFGLTPPEMTDGAVSDTAERTPAQILDYLESPIVRRLLNFDGNITLSQSVINLSQAEPGAEYIINARGQGLDVDSLLAEWYKAGVPEGTTYAELQNLRFITTHNVSTVDTDFGATVQKVIPTIDALTDGLMFLRRAFGVSPEDAIDNAVDITSDLTDEQVAANIAAAFNLQVVLDNNTLVPLAEGAPVADIPVTRLTYTLNQNSIRTSFPQDSPIYVQAGEYSPDTPSANILSHNNIVNSGDLYRAGSSAWNVSWDADTIVEDDGVYFATIKEIRSKGFSNPLYAPLILVEALTAGHFSAEFSVLADTSNGIPTTSGAEEENDASFRLQGHAGPTKTVEQMSPTYLQSEGELREQLDLAPWGEIIRWEVNDETSGNDPISVVVSEENCNIARKNTRHDVFSSGSSFLITPGFGGERYRATLSTKFENGKTFKYIIEGKIKGQAKTAEGVFNSDTLFGSPNNNVVVVSEPLQGRDGIVLSQVIQVNWTESQIRGMSSQTRGVVGQMLTTTQRAASGGQLVTRTGPLKAVRKSNNRFDLVFESALFIPDGSPTWSCDIQTTMDLNQPQTITYNSDFSGTYKDDFGVEVISKAGGTRIDTTAQSLRFITSEKGIQTGNTSSTETSTQQSSRADYPNFYVEDSADIDVDRSYFDMGTFNGRAQYDQASQRWLPGTRLITDSPFKTRWHTVSAYWNGQRIGGFSYYGQFDDGQFSSSTLFMAENNLGYKRGTFIGEGHNQITQKYTQRWGLREFLFVYNYDTTFHENSTSLLDGVTAENVGDFAVLNMERESMVDIEFNYDSTNGTVSRIPSNWVHRGDIQEHLNTKYALMYLKLGGD